MTTVVLLPSGRGGMCAVCGVAWCVKNYSRATATSRIGSRARLKRSRKAVGPGISEGGSVSLLRSATDLCF